MGMNEPTTEAGRRLLNRVYLRDNWKSSDAFAVMVAAIEREARTAALVALREQVAAQQADALSPAYTMGFDDCRVGTLALIDAALANGGAEEGA